MFYSNYKIYFKFSLIKIIFIINLTIYTEIKAAKVAKIIFKSISMVLLLT